MIPTTLRSRIGSTSCTQVTNVVEAQASRCRGIGNPGFAVGLLRHPPVRVAAGTCYGRSEVLLAAGWRGQLPELLARLAAIRPTPVCPLRVWTSPQRRCATVAEALGGRLRALVRRDERLRELDFGEWERRRWEAVPRRDLDRWAADPLGFAPPGGESGATLLARVQDFAEMLIRLGQPCVVLSHGGPLRLLPALLGGEEARLLAAPPPPGHLQIVFVETG